MSVWLGVRVGVEVGMVVAVWWGGEWDGAIPICFPSPPQLSDSELWCVRFQDLIICEYGMSDL